MTTRQATLYEAFKVVIDLATQGMIDPREQDMQEMFDQQSNAITQVQEHAEEFLGREL